MIDGLPVTTVTRTVVDLARSTPFEADVVTADAALRRGHTSTAQLRDCLSGMGAVPGVRAAARVVGFADGLSESVGESRSRVLIHRLALPVPDLQVRVRRADGRRSDGATSVGNSSGPSVSSTGASSTGACCNPVSIRVTWCSTRSAVRTS